MSTLPTDRAAYKKHTYSGPRKSIKRVQAGLKRFHGGEISRSVIWRKKAENSPINGNVGNGYDESKTRHRKIKTYERKRTKIKLESVFCLPCTSTTETIIEPQHIGLNRFQPEPKMENFEMTDQKTHENAMLKFGVGLKHCLSIHDRQSMPVIDYSNYLSTAVKEEQVAIKEEQVAIKEETIAEEELYGMEERDKETTVKDELISVEEITHFEHVDILTHIEQSLDGEKPVKDESVDIKENILFEHVNDSTNIEQSLLDGEKPVKDELIDIEENILFEHVDNSTNIEQSLLNETNSSNDMDLFFYCDTCKKKCKTKYGMSHLRSHIEEKPYNVCNGCNKSFTLAYNLKGHMQIDTSEKPYVICHICNICSKIFSHPILLKQHMITHTGEKPYTCNKCSKTFSQASPLKRHMRTHTGEKS